jgi:HAMP domain-containing protein
MAATAPRFGMLDLPRPGRAALPLLALAALALLLEADTPLRLVGLAAAGCFALAAAVRVLRARRELASIRRAVDRQILAAPSAGTVSELVQWRAHELVAAEERAALARELGAVLHQLDPQHLPSASPLRRAAVRPHADLLRAIRDRLGDEEPVTPRGMLLVHGLLREGSPLYTDASDEELARTLARVRGALEP